MTWLEWTFPATIPLADCRMNGWTKERCESNTFLNIFISMYLFREFKMLSKFNGQYKFDYGH